MPFPLPLPPTAPPLSLTPPLVLQEAIAELRVKTVRYFRGLQRLGHASGAGVTAKTKRLNSASDITFETV